MNWGLCCFDICNCLRGLSSVDFFFPILVSTRLWFIDWLSGSVTSNVGFPSARGLYRSLLRLIATAYVHVKNGLQGLAIKLFFLNGKPTGSRVSVGPCCDLLPRPMSTLSSALESRFPCDSVTGHGMVTVIARVLMSGRLGAEGY
jgi:hypothetical protein